MNKKGADKLLSVYWFVILIATAGGISAMVFNFYSYPYDVREVESKILSDKISDCVSQGGILNSEIIDANGKFIDGISENIMKICNLNFNPESSFSGEEQFYFEINFYSASNKDVSIMKIEHGNSAWKSDCEISETKDYKNLAKCYNDEFYSVDYSKKAYLVKILTITKKTEKNVK